MKIIKSENTSIINDWSSIIYPALITYSDEDIVVFALSYDEHGGYFKGFLISGNKEITFPDYSDQWISKNAKLYTGTIMLSNF